ncbi:protein spinster homolog 1 isoform X2 [Cuculus canorus]|nr:protein spinster homolog 1 isoform X2 [Cuculus canorus]XP_053908977.1 protein spinster homolog 1 isoform X2 [Cuculus canorus]XP_053908978.1 protein spinster homolog 1 isoform X2 [Cuculus canorus]
MASGGEEEEAAALCPPVLPPGEEPGAPQLCPPSPLPHGVSCPTVLPHSVSCPTALPHGVSPARAHLTVLVLCYINLLNYMDRFTVASVLPDVEDYFGIGDSSSGLLQTVFISSYTVLAPLFGYLGDRRSRRRLLGLGLGLWSAVTLGSSFVPKERFWLLLVGRGLVGVGEASYSTIAPTLIADLFAGAARSRALGAFYLALPVGSGLGFVVGAKVKEAAADWRWALRVTPALGALALVLLVLLVAEPPRGVLEPRAPPPVPRPSWATDLRLLATNRTLVLSTLGFTAVAFVTGALALWGPAFLYRSRVAAGRGPACGGGRCERDESLVFGALTCGAGVLGVAAGVELSRRLRSRTRRGDALLCGGGLLASAPCLLAALLAARRAPNAAYVFIFLGEALLSLNWALVADILLDVVVPSRRATAEALQIVASHLLGDAGSPLLIGVVSDALQGGFPGGLAPAPALLRALLLAPFVAALGGAAFLAAAIVLPHDRRAARGLDADDVIDDVTARPRPPSAGGGSK